MTRYAITAPSTPGATPTVQGKATTLREARTIAHRFADRRDLTGQDVRIERTDSGQLVEYAGPAR